MSVAAVSRRGGAPVGDKYRDKVHGYACDATIGSEVAALFTKVTADLGPPDVVIFNVGTWDIASIADITEEMFEATWRIGCFGGFLVGRAAARSMLPRGKGTILFTGATASMRGGANFAAFAVPKFGLRALAQSMARELHPKGIHVGHVIVDGMIGQEGAASPARMTPSAIAESYYALHRQERSAWTHEIDLRPFSEKF
jgi:NAD(P)-dependent dehydrogenase (short-subunit alcohol dehydrogenase family)